MTGSPTFDAQNLADHLVGAHRSHVALKASEIAAEPADLTDIYAVQQRVADQLGPVGGFKIGRWADGRFMMAPIPSANIRKSPARFDGDELRVVGIELEIAFLVTGELPRPDAADFDARLCRAVSVVPAIEIVDSRLADLAGSSDYLKLADNQSGYGLVVGAPIANWQDLELTAGPITLTVNGVQTGPTRGKVPGGGSAFDMLKGLLGIVGSHCGGLRQGSYVTTGALSGLFWIDRASEVTGSIDGFGDVAVEIGA